MGHHAIKNHISGCMLQSVACALKYIQEGPLEDSQQLAKYLYVFVQGLTVLILAIVVVYAAALVIAIIRIEMVTIIIKAMLRWEWCFDCPLIKRLGPI